MEIEQKIIQQNVVIVFKNLEINGVLEKHQKQFGTSKRLYCNCFGGIYRKKPVLIYSSVTLLKQDLDSQYQQNKQLQKDNNYLRIYLDQLEKNYKEMQEQFYQLIQEKEELSPFEIDSDEDMHS